LKEVARAPSRLVEASSGPSDDEARTNYPTRRARAQPLNTSQATVKLLLMYLDNRL